MLLNQLQQDMKDAFKAGDSTTKGTLSMTLSALKNKKIELGVELTDEQVMQVLASEAKKKKESIEQFKSGNREDLVANEQAELDVLERYLPRQLSDENLSKLVDEVIAEASPFGIKDMGRIVKTIKDKVSGQADGTRISVLVKNKLSKLV